MPRKSGAVQLEKRLEVVTKIHGVVWGSVSRVGLERLISTSTELVEAQLALCKRNAAEYLRKHWRVSKNTSGV